MKNWHPFVLGPWFACRQRGQKVAHHRDKPLRAMRDVEVFVWERPAVDRPDPRAVAVDNVAALDREAGHDAVESRTLVAAPTLAGAQLAEVLRGPVS